MNVMTDMNNTLSGDVFSSPYSFSETLDTKGTRCPIPLLRAKTALKKMQSGEYLLVLATDPSAKADFDAMLRHLPHELVEYVSKESQDQPKVDYFAIRKG